MKNGAKYVACPVCEMSFKGETVPPHDSRLMRNDFALQPCPVCLTCGGTGLGTISGSFCATCKGEGDQPLPTLEGVRQDERPTPLVAEPPPFTLTAEVSQRRDHQPALFNGIEDDDDQIDQTPHGQPLDFHD